MTEQITGTYHVWTKQRVIVGLPLVIILVFSLVFTQMQSSKTKAQQVPAAASTPTVSPAVASSKSLPTLPLAPSKKLPAVMTANNSSTASQTATPQPVTQTMTSLQAAAAGSPNVSSPEPQNASSPNAQQDLPQVPDVLHAIKNINTQPLNSVVKQGLL